MSLNEPQFFGSPWIDRAARLRRDPERLAALHHDPDARYLLMRGGKNLVAGDDEPVARSLAPEQLPPSSSEGDGPVFLGLEAERAWFALELAEDDEPPLPRGCRWVDLRREGPRLTARDAGLLAYARAILHWHENHRFCGRCGSPTEFRSAGFLRRCPRESCRREHFPRTDPAIIVRVTHGDRVLLGRQASWPRKWYSVLAGFVEPGESLEDAVRREVFEEVGVSLASVDYFASQPWPFPASLMVGFVAEAEASALDLDDDELDDARWMTRTEIRRQTAARELRISPTTSISGVLLADWLQGDEG